MLTRGPRLSSSIVPLALVVGGHILYPFLLNVSNMQRSHGEELELTRLDDAKQPAIMSLRF